MDEQQTLWSFMWQQSDKLLTQTCQHIGLTFISLGIAVIIGLPVGILITRKRKLSGVLLGIAGVFQTIPSIALLGFMIPLLGIGVKPAITALFLYALLPIIRNTYTGIIGVAPSLKEAAEGMGMNRWQVLFRLELPLALPVILAGIRTATVINVGVATLASYIAAGGLGEFIFGGISLNNTNMILAGAIPAALLAIVFDFLLSRIQKLDVKNIKKTLVALPLVIALLACFYILPTSYGSKLSAGFTPEFMGRQDGNLGLEQQYGLKIHPIVIGDAVMYKAIYDKKLDVISGYSTDGRLKAYDLMVLEDDKSIFPPYYAAPIIRADALRKFPGLETTLNLLAGKIDDETMTELNYKADYLHQSPEKIAKEFLLQHHLWQQPRPKKVGAATVRIGSKIFGEQYILSSIYQMLILGYTDYNVSTKTGLGGTKICFDALTNDQIDFYPEYTGTGLLAILHPSKNVVDSLGTHQGQIYAFVDSAFQKKYHIKWLRPIGFNNTYALMMRRAQATKLHIKSITDLKNYLENR